MQVVQQGSVLGPLLILIYINDFYRCSKVFDFHIFVDDTNLFYSNNSLLALESCINENVLHVSSWLIANKLSLNGNKTKAIVFRTSRRHMRGPLNVLKLNISRDDNVKNMQNNQLVSN